VWISSSKHFHEDDDTPPIKPLTPTPTLPPYPNRSAEQREQLDALLTDIYEHWVDTIAAARNKSREEVEGLLNEGVYDMSKLVEGACVCGVGGGGWGWEGGCFSLQCVCIASNRAARSGR